MANWISTSVKIDEEILDALNREADDRVIGRNLLINMALKRFLDNLIPIEQATKEKEADNEKAANEDRWTYGNRFSRYLVGSGVPSGTPEGEPNPSSSTTGVSGGDDGPDPECPGVRMDVSGATYGPPGEMPAQAESVRPHDADRRVDLDRAEHGGGSFDVVQ